MSKKPKEQKHAVANKPALGDDKPVIQPRTMTVWSEYEKAHKQMTLEQAVRDSIKYWGAPTFGVSTAWYAEPGPSGLVTATMKRCGYEPILDRNGKFEPVNGMYNFQYIKPTE